MKYLLAGLHAEGPSCLNYPPITTSPDGQHRSRQVRTWSPALAMCCSCGPSFCLSTSPPSCSQVAEHSHSCPIVRNTGYIARKSQAQAPAQQAQSDVVFLEELGRLMPSSESGRCRVIILTISPCIESVCRCQSQMGLRE